HFERLKHCPLANGILTTLSTQSVQFLPRFVTFASLKEPAMFIDTVDWKLIGTCNLRCRHCYGPRKTHKSLPLRELFALINKFDELNVQWLVLTGGEPLL